MRAMIIIGHGSRSAEATVQFHQIVDMVKARQAGTLVLPAFMENAEPKLADALAEAIAAGANEIVVVPCFMYQGMHIKHDIPEMLAELTAQHPQITMRVAQPIGADPRIAEILCERAEEILCLA